MKPRTLALLALVVAGLAAFVLLYERDQPSTEERRGLAKRVFRVEAEAITRLEIETGPTRVVLEREAPGEDPEAEASSLLPAPARWRLVEPFGSRADRALVERLTSEIANLELLRRIDGASRADVGLEPARGVVRWRSESAEGSLEIGGEVPASSTVVVAASGHPDPLVVADTLVASLERAPGDWRAKELFDAGREEVERIRMVPAGGGEVVLSRRGERFAVERPFADSADRDLVDPLLGELTALRAERFLDAPLSEADESAILGGPGRLEISVRGRTDPLVIEIGSERGDPGVRALRVDGQAVEARARLDEGFGRPMADWRSRSWSGFDSWRVERLRVEDGQGVLELVRDGGDWSRDGVTVPYDVAADLLHAVTSARAERVALPSESGRFPLAHPSLTIVLADAEGTEETLTAYDASKPGEIPARVSGRDVVLLLPETIRNELGEPIAAVRAAEPPAGD